MDSFTMERTSVRINDACNLKCKLCAVYEPYIASKSYLISYLEEEIKRYFCIVDFCKKFTLVGGEPLLHPNLANIIKHMERYADQIGELQIVTNGTIVPSKEVLEAGRVFAEKLFYLVDDYGNVSVKINEIDTMLTAYGVRHEIRNYTSDNPHCDGWVDFGNPVKQIWKTEGEIEAVYAKCAYPQKMKFCFGIVDGLLYPCTQFRRCLELGVVDNDNEYINLFDDSLTIEEQRTKIRSIYQGKKLSACAYCNGLCDDSPRVIPAQQLTSAELVCVRNGARSYAEVVQMMEQCQ